MKVPVTCFGAAIIARTNDYMNFLYSWCQAKSKSRWKSSNGSGAGERDRVDTSVINEELVAKVNITTFLHDKNRYGTIVFEFSHTGTGLNYFLNYVTPVSFSKCLPIMEAGKWCKFS
jgi:hypothetical protein